MFLHREADSRLTAVKALFPYYFNSTMFIAHGTGSAYFLPIPCNQRKDEGDPRLSSSWAVSSMTQRKILNPTCGWSPTQICTPILPDFIRNALVFWLMPSAFSESTVVSYSSYIQVGFLGREVQRRHGTHLPLLRQSRKKMVTTSIQEAKDFQSGFL